jgi:hypothetical protein
VSCEKRECDGARMVEIFPSKYSAYKYNMSRWSRLDGQMVGRMVCLLSCVN